MNATMSAVRRRVYEAVNYRLRTFANGRWASHCRPVSIVFLLTERCNARCVHCDIWKNRGREDSPTPEQWKRVLSDLRSWLGPVQVVFSGGEALLRPWAIDVVSHAASLGLYVEHLTHGYWIDQAKIEQLAMTGASRFTVSLDGLGAVHDLVRGRPGFFEKTSATIATLQRLRQEHGLRYTVRLKTVLMSHNLEEAAKIARFASVAGTEVFYQPIEQNYNTPEDAHWFEHSPNWPKDSHKAVSVVNELIQLKRDGCHIANSLAQLDAMCRYFENPAQLRVAVQSHAAHEQRALCAALINLEFKASGDVTVCTGIPPVGNVKGSRIREIWEQRPRVWLRGCCLERKPQSPETSGPVSAP
jgi:MoaA/NifB/PqqE/SkfB family radical SAM enzyme